MKKNNQKCSIFNWHFLILTGLVNILVCKSVFEMEFSLAGMIQRPMCQMNKTIWIMKWTIMLRFLWHLFHVREGCRKKKSGKSVVFCQTRGGGVSGGKQKTKPQVCKCVFFRIFFAPFPNDFIILWTPVQLWLITLLIEIQHDELMIRRPFHGACPRPQWQGQLKPAPPPQQGEEYVCEPNKHANMNAQNNCLLKFLCLLTFISNQSCYLDQFVNWGQGIEIYVNEILTFYHNWLWLNFCATTFCQSLTSSSKTWQSWWVRTVPAKVFCRTGTLIQLLAQIW